MVRPAGIEPATLGFGGQYSIHWATGASSKNNHLAIVSAYNASSRYNHGKVTLSTPSNDKSPMSNEHGSLIKSPKQLIIMVFASFFVPLIIILLLMVYVNSGKRDGGESADAAKSTEQLIKPVAQLNFKDASAPRELQTGEQVYKAVCSSCHATGAAGAPKFGDASAWAPRIAKGYDSLMTSVIKGKGAMPARGGSNPTDISDYELGRAVVYMANSAGGKLPEPKAPAAATK